MGIQAFQRGYMDKLAQLSGLDTVTTVTNAPERVRDAYGAWHTVVPAGSNPDPSEGRSDPNPALDAATRENAKASVVPDENLPAGEIPAVVEPLDGDKSEWDGVSGPVYYTVQPGDVLGRIAREFGNSEKQIQDLNGLSDPDKIRAGSRLRVR